jgi:hypothetical protein
VLFAAIFDGFADAEHQLMTKDEMRELGALSTFIGIQVESRSLSKVFIHRKAYPSSFLEGIGFIFENGGARIPSGAKTVFQPTAWQNSLA